MNSISEMHPSEWQIAENYRQTSKAWVEADHQARLLEEEKTSELEARKSALITAATGEKRMTDAEAERLVKSSPEWRDYLRRMVQARTDAALLRERMNYINKLEWAKNIADANRRADMRLHGTM